MRLVPCFVLGGALVSAAAMSCTLPNLDDYVTPDAGTPAAGDAGPDGGDASNGEGGTTVAEAGAEAGANDGGANESGTPACTVDYCNSFDGKLDDFITEPTATAKGGTIVIEDGVLRSTAPAHTSGDASLGQASRIVSQTARSAIVEVDVRIDQSADSYTGSATIFQLDFLGADASSFADFQLYAGPTYADLTPLLSDHTFTPDRASADMPRGRVFHLRFEGNFDAANGSYKMFFDGTQVGGRSGIAFGGAAKGALRIDLGVDANNAVTPGLSVTYDNLTVDLP